MRTCEGHSPAIIVGLVLLGLAASPAAATSLTRGPYLQLLTRQSVTVVWNTDTPAACALAIRPPDGLPILRAGGTGTVCAIAVDGLTPGTSYAYTPLADGAALSGEAVFRTDDATRPFSFLAVGDSGCGCSGALAVRDAMRATPADFIIHTGDMVYDSGAPQEFDPNFFVPYHDLLARLVMWPCRGNHDVETAGGAPWRDAFYTPANNPAGSEDYYSFDEGNAHFVMLDSNASTKPGSPQYTFLDHDLAASTATWKVVVFHHTIYSSGTKHGSNLTIRANLVPLFDTHGVDLVLAAHEHNYERTKPLRNNQVVSAGQGTVYVTTGGGGQELYTVGTSSFTAHSESVHHFTRVAVNGGNLLAQMVRVDGSIGDEFTLVKGTALPPRCGDGVVNQPGEQCDGADRAACPGPCASDCTCAPVCGDGRVDQPGEACDGSDDAACPGLCLSTCRCGVPADFATLTPVADTFIASGTQASWDHGAADHLDAQALVDVAYLKFDLSALPAPVARATLTLRCIDGSPEGGTIYPVADAGWVEGNRTGADATSALGPGLKWSDVDTNHDGVLDTRDTSPWVPQFLRAMRGFGRVAPGLDFIVDVTSAFQGGPGLYCVAITNNSDDKAAYASRESASPPFLRVELVDPGTTTTSTSTTSTSTSSTTTSTTTTSTTVTTTSITTSTTTSTTATTSTTSTASTTSSTTSSTSTSSTTSTTSPTTSTMTTTTVSTTSTTSSTISSSSTTSTTVGTTSTTTAPTSTTSTSTTSTTSTSSSTTSSTTSSTSTTSATVPSTSTTTAPTTSTTESTTSTTSSTSSTSTTQQTSTTSTTSSTSVSATSTSSTTEATTSTTSTTEPATSTTSTTVPTTSTSAPTTTVTSTTTSLPATSTTVPPEECQTDADCDRGDVCRPSRCVDHRCQDAPLVSLQAVRCALEPEAAGAACTRRTLPPGVSLSLGRAEAAIEGAQQAPSVKRTRNGVRSAVRLMDAAARSVRRAETGHSIDGDCARVLRGMLRDARARARRYLKNGPERAAAIDVRRVALVS